MLDKIKSYVVAQANRARRFVGSQLTDRNAKAAALALAALCVLCTPAMAQIELPEAPVDVAGYVNAALTRFGTVIAACVAAFFAVLCVTLGFRWGKRALAG